ncbi:hypothetical protein J3A64_003551 [Pseudarthrobacter sp. PvP004]|jgi:hypothetical protein|uniref:Uncharacterized protein n=1 Tax=Paenarthrobacter aurescens (strain TC1) TaxID=290340 RepID=A1R151_PAEAT|nr:hypothetical protein AAur_0135 [Paenarthrobacter aurescens TC1]MBP2268087.1 hypothetical protein [Pseudarthrobacter sp. PvP004]
MRAEKGTTSESEHAVRIGHQRQTDTGSELYDATDTA